MITQAVRLPAAKLGRIEQEGRNLLGIKLLPPVLKDCTLVSVSPLFLHIADTPTRATSVFRSAIPEPVTMSGEFPEMPPVYYGSPKDSEGNSKQGFEDDIYPKATNNSNSASSDLINAEFYESGQQIRALHTLSLHYTPHNVHELKKLSQSFASKLSEY